MVFNFRGVSFEERPFDARIKPPSANAAEFCAWAALISAIRHQHHLWGGHSACIALVVPDVFGFYLFKDCWDAVATFVASRRRGCLHHGHGQFITFERGKKARKTEDDEGPVAVSRLCLGLARSRDDFPPSFLIEADAIVEARRPTRRDLVAAGRVVAGIRFTDADLELAERITLANLGLAIRAGRPHHLIREALRRAAVAAELPSSTPSSTGSPRLTLDVLPGFGEAAAWGHQLAVDLADWRQGTLPWSDVDRGILLSGPPGTGKTTFAKALAGTCGVPLVLGSLGRWQAAGHLGQMLKAMRGAFDDARRQAPSILLIDELDAVGDRGRMDADDLHYGGQVVAALLECLDGAEGREGVVVVGATNFPDHIDPAIKRPGRLDRHVIIPLPDRAARADILRHHGADLPQAALERVAARLEGRSGADIEGVVRAARRRARIARRPLVIADLFAELPRTVLVPDSIRYRSAIHEAGHAIVAYALGFGTVTRVAIATEVDMRSGVQLGGGASIERDVVMNRTRDEMMTEIAVLMAGGAAEELVLGNRGEGSGGDTQSDLARATVIAGAMVASTGLGGTYTFLAPMEPGDVATVVRMVPEVRVRVEKALADAAQTARRLLEGRRDMLDGMISALLSAGNIEQDALNDLLS